MILTEKQEAVLNFIEEYQLAHGKSPTLRETREFFGVSSDNAVLKHLKALEEKGFIKKDATPRGIGLLPSIKKKLDAVTDIFKLPLLGEIPAGGPVLVEENYIDYLNVGEVGIKNPKASFLLRVRGDSMINAGIHEGDMVIVNSEMIPKINDIVAALVDKEVTIKRYMRDKDKKFYLKPENENYENIYPSQDLQIQGVVTGLIRTY